MYRAHEIIADDVTVENGRGVEEISLASRHSQLVLPADGGVAHVGEGINFYLRLGALGKLFRLISPSARTHTCTQTVSKMLPSKPLSRD